MSLKIPRLSRLLYNVHGREVESRGDRISLLGSELKRAFPCDVTNLEAALNPKATRVGVSQWLEDHTEDDPRVPITNVFVDFSNIRIGFEEWLRVSEGSDFANHLRPLDFRSLSLVLERGRLVSHRVLVTSSRNPTYPGRAIRTAKECGYKCNVRDRISAYGGLRHNRECGVDEELHGEIYRALDQGLFGRSLGENTIVLVTGDGKPGEFDKLGFPGCIERALEESWRIELYSWERNISRIWEKKFGGHSHFSSHLPDSYAKYL